MFEAPGSSIKFVLVNGKVARKECAPLYFARGQGGMFREMVESEEGEGKEEEKGKGGGGGGEVGTFEEYREKTRVAGVM